MSTELETLKWQYGLTWRLAQVHLPALTDEVCLWEAAAGACSVRKSHDGIWHPDWSDVEPDPVPTVTVGWLTWHLIWWWSSVLAAVRGDAPVIRDEVAWPGSAAEVLRRLNGLHAAWRAVLEGLAACDLDRPTAYPWPEPRPLRLTIAWVNGELMKNVAEIGYARLLFEASHR